LDNLGRFSCWIAEFWLTKNYLSIVYDCTHVIFPWRQLESASAWGESG